MAIQLLNGVINQGNSPALRTGTFAQRPAAGQVGRKYFSTDTLQIFEDTGTTWQDYETGNVTGSGTAGTLSKFSSTGVIADSIVKEEDASNILVKNSVRIGYGGGGVSSNTAFGNNALTVNTTGSTSSAFGQSALGSQLTGTANAAFGRAALNLATAASNSTGLGTNAGRSCLGSFLTAVGAGALVGVVGSLGDRCVAVGYNSLSLLTTGVDNTAIGYRAGVSSTSGQFNTFIGHQSGNGIQTGNYNTIIGAQMAVLAAALSNNIILSDGQGNIGVQFDNTGLASFRAGANFPGNIVAANVYSSTWTPTITLLVNCTLNSVTVGFFSRVGDQVTIGGQLSLKSTAAAIMQFNLSMPVTTNFANEFQGTGSLNAIASFGVPSYPVGVFFSLNATSVMHGEISAANAVCDYIIYYTATYRIVP